jgi:hypothetical protein
VAEYAPLRLPFLPTRFSDPPAAVPCSHASIRLPSHTYATALPLWTAIATVARAPSTRPAKVPLASGTAAAGPVVAAGSAVVEEGETVAAAPAAAGPAGLLLALALSISSTNASPRPINSVRCGPLSFMWHLRLVGAYSSWRQPAARRGATK